MGPKTHPCGRPDVISIQVTPASIVVRIKDHVKDNHEVPTLNGKP